MWLYRKFTGTTQQEISWLRSGHNRQATLSRSKRAAMTTDVISDAETEDEDAEEEIDIYTGKIASNF